MSFVHSPVLQMTMTGFGGVDISSIPLAYALINSSFYSILDEVSPLLYYTSYPFLLK